ncbi:serine/threonine-protein kinase BLUS1-like isoform X1 [Salvia hispanica]|uniref:serine/threonine-protein kinase BLUS1-like isoform X1 n=1 Tax=Salvia hispanica TaxID=49212 RepID=UPI002008FEC0|nr:serine/threonine-protein kinase BLUS1-like isoform X1 [Salvia hispanica]XP_047970709.1 serine/threonine-protein kinase BLUS1-like isoform X1 [Salvia hispanica]XP_047970710.1 serine/threonine-protein kinase BLUS1-like isoform X1 [Salvia hispanica]XP_047970711.1 serine/threonine-protein kinase BLUS1-like isoform X1 [Salvia hispanica]XP_047970712.1 serine/threonine-protein kinase BLUS1-like isoform X1 [Salvia hispanica]XP_047970713.1 serine/threonine-protein kinase BLUS1-like isoform X1 [Salvi
MSQEPAKKFPLNAQDYELYEEVGEGVSATVYRALCIPLNEVVAIKVLDLEKCNNDLDGIRREVQTMILIDHPNLLRAHCSFTAGHNLWVVMPYMAGGSCLHIMKSSYPEGFEEPVIATLLRETLRALVYLHSHGHIHRDVKSGNILLDSNGAVKLGDYGVSACMYDTGDRQRTRNTFVGTPCWMAPEVMQQLHGYDFKADIWSFGITALELAHGHAPFSKYPPMKVLLMTLQNAPPGLDYERDKRFSKSFKEMVAACLVKDPKKRPTSEKLLKHPFFKHARSIEYLERGILAGMPPLGERFRLLKAKEADMLVQNKALYEDKEHLSQQEYIRGISAWNFNLDDLKNQAALIPDDFVSNSDDASVSGKYADGQESLFSEKDSDSKAVSNLEDELNDLPNMEDSLAAFPMKPLQALKGCFDVSEDDIAATSPTSRDSVPSDFEQQNPQQSSTSAVDREAGTDDGLDPSHSSIAGRRKFSSGSLLQEYVLSPRKLIGNGDRDHLQPRFQVDRNSSGPLQYRHKKDFSIPNAGEDASEGAIVERRGRFKVTSADVSPKGSMNLVSPVSGGSTSPTIPSHSGALILPSLQFILQQNTAQRDEILKLMKMLEQPSGNGTELTEAGTLSPINPTLKERELQTQIMQLQQSIGSVVDELHRVKAKNSQLERKLNAVLKQDDKVQ